MIFRTYPALRYLLFLGAGIVVAGKLSLVVALSGLVLSLLVGMLSLRVKGTRHLIPFSFFFLGAALMLLQERSRPALHRAEGALVEIVSGAEARPASYKAVGRVLAENHRGRWESSDGKVLLYFDRSANVVPEYGEIYRVNGSLREIEGPKTPFEFNYRQYLATQQIYHQGFLRPADFRKLGESGRRSLMGYAHRANAYTHRVFSEVLTGPGQLGVAEAMIGGMRGELDAETLQWYTDTGTVHALAVSGMHIAILFWVLNTLFGLFLNKRKWPFIACVLFFLWSYAIFAGLSPSVCRSTLMFTLFQVGIFLRRTGNPVNTLFFSALVLLILVPGWIRDVGFQLSYLAVLGILVFYPWVKSRVRFRWKPVQWLWEATAVSVAAQVYTLPLTLYYFHQFPNYMLLANPVVGLIAMPLLPVGLLLLFLYPVPVAGYAVGQLFKGLIEAMNVCVYHVHNLPGAVTHGLALSVAGVLLMYGVILLFQGYLRFRRVEYLQCTAALFTVLMLWGGGKRILQHSQEEITFHALPKGYGLSLVKGRSAVFLSSDTLLRDPQVEKYHLRNYYDARGIARRRTRAVEPAENELLRTGAGDVFWVKAANTRNLQPARYTLVSNNALDPAAARHAGLLILDASNRRGYMEEVRKINPQAIVLNETGSKTFIP